MSQCAGCKKTWTCDPSGPMDARMLVVLEWPEEQDGLSQSPMSGGYGRVVAWALKAVGIRREDIRIEYAMHCGPWNRVPSPKQVRECASSHLLSRFGSMKKLRVVVPLGAKALEALTGCRNLVNTTKSPGWAGSVLSAEDVREMATHSNLIWPSPSCYMLPTFSPKFLMDGNKRFMDVFKRHMQVAAHIAATGKFDRMPTEYRVMDKHDELREWLTDASVLALDLETTMDWKKIELVGLSKEPGKAVVVPGWNHSLRDILTPILGDPGVPKVMHNASFDEARLLEHGVPVVRNIWDTMVGASAYASHLPVALGFVGPFYTDVKQWKHMASTNLIEYNGIDVDVTRRLYDIQQEQFKARGFLKHATEVVMPSRQIMLMMERQGIRIDEDARQRMLKESHEKEDALRKEWDELTGGLNPASAPQKVKYFIEEGRVKWNQRFKTKTGKPALNQQALEWYAEKYPMERSLQVLKELGSEAALRKGNLDIEVDERGRCHFHYVQVSRTGRAASGSDKTDPTKVSATSRFNAMNVPVPYRVIYIPDEGYEFCEVDYSGIEFHILAALAQDEVALEAFHSGKKIHGVVAAEAFGVTYEEVMDEYVRSGGAADCMYQVGKKIRHSMSYGAGDRKLASISGQPERTCFKIRTAEAKTFARIAAYKQERIRLAKKQGFLDNPFGRRCYFPEGRPTEMLAFTPQSTAFDVAAKGLVRIKRSVTLPLAFTHDSFLTQRPLSGPTREEWEERLRKALCIEYPEIMPGFVPKVDFAWGKNWKECK